MHYITAFFRFWYTFIIGDDWTIAAIVVAAILLTFWLANHRIPAWWVLPLAAMLALGLGLWRSAKGDSR